MNAERNCHEILGVEEIFFSCITFRKVIFTSRGNSQRKVVRFHNYYLLRVKTIIEAIYKRVVKRKLLQVERMYILDFTN